MDINGRKHVLKHGGHEFDLHAIRSEVVKDQKGMMRELLVVHPVFLQRRHHVFDEAILQKKKKKSPLIRTLSRDNKSNQDVSLGNSVRLL